MQLGGYSYFASGGMLVAWFAYEAALGSARLYAQQVKAAFDLYRNELLIQMRLPLPTNPKEEREQKSSGKTLTSATLKEFKQIENRYTLIPVPKDKPLSKDKLGPQVESDRISNTVAIGISATPAMALGGNLEAGDIVDVIIVPAATKSEPQLTSVLLPDILVLDVKSMPENKSPTKQLSDSPFVVVVALPVARLQEFATKSVGAKLLITRKL